MLNRPVDFLGFVAFVVLYGVIVTLVLLLFGIAMLSRSTGAPVPKVKEKTPSKPKPTPTLSYGTYIMQWGESGSERYETILHEDGRYNCVHWVHKDNQYYGTWTLCKKSHILTIKESRTHNPDQQPSWVSYSFKMDEDYTRGIYESDCMSMTLKVTPLRVTRPDL